MKQACRKFSVFLFAVAFLAPASLLAQKEDKEKDKEAKEKKQSEQIIITRKGDGNEKMVIEIVGDKVTVNGKPVEDLKDGDVSVRRNRIRDTWSYADGIKGQIINGIGGADAFRYMNVDSNRAMLGVTTEKSEDGSGVEIRSITKESAASKIGLKKGDVITKIDDIKIDDPDDLSAAIKKHKPGDKVSVTFQRDKKQETVTTELGKYKGTNVFSVTPDTNFKIDLGDMNMDHYMPRGQAAPRAPYGVFSRSGSPRLGLSVQDTDDGKGVKVISVDEESNAAKAGLKEEDVITEIDGKAVNSADEVAKIIKDSKDKVSVMVKLQRGGKTQNMEVKIPRKLKTADL
jgi:serine protease Do